MKKLIVSLTLVVILFNFIFLNNAYADGVEAGRTKDTKMTNEFASDNSAASNDMAVKQLEDGTADDGTGNNKSLNMSTFGTTIMGTILSILAGLVNIIVFQLDLIMGQLSYSTEVIDTKNDFQYFFTIERTVFNRIPLFNINFFDTEDTYLVGDIEVKASTSINKIKERVAEIFYTVRLISTAAALVVLVYIGIRMAISTLADDKAKYKKMLVGWIESIVVLFLLEYIMIAVIVFGEFLIEIFFKIEQEIVGDETTFEPLVRNQLFTLIFSGGTGIQYALNSLMYWILLFMQLKYFWLYLKRFLMVGFLVMIAPLITVTYAIDKAGDGKAQAFAIWLKEFVVNVLIQPLHALIYMVFIGSAGEIAKTSPIIAIAFIMCMGAVERMVKIIFDLDKLVSLRGVDKLGKKQ